MNHSLHPTNILFKCLHFQDTFNKVHSNCYVYQPCQKDDLYHEIHMEKDRQEETLVNIFPVDCACILSGWKDKFNWIKYACCIFNFLQLLYNMWISSCVYPCSSMYSWHCMCAIKCLCGCTRGFWTSTQRLAEESLADFRESLQVEPQAPLHPPPPLQG